MCLCSSLDVSPHRLEACFSNSLLAESGEALITRQRSWDQKRDNHVRPLHTGHHQQGIDYYFFKQVADNAIFWPLGHTS